MEAAGKSESVGNPRVDTNRSRTRGVFALREGGGAADGQRALSQLEQEVVALRRSRVSSVELAEQVLQLLHRLIELHGITRTDTTGIKLFFQSLRGHAVMQQATLDLYEMALRCTLDGSVDAEASALREGVFEGVGVSRALTHLLRWYRERLSTLELLDSAEPEVSVLDLHSFADAMSQGLYGIESVFRVFVGQGVTVDASDDSGEHSDRAAWGKMSLFRSDGSPVRTRSNWGSWVDELSGDGSTGVSVLAPISSALTPTVVDRFSLFIPYDACELPSGLTELEVRCATLDQEGCVLSESSVSLKAVIPPPQPLGAALPAPQSLGLWSEDFGSGDRISNLAVERGFSVSIPDLEILRLDVDVHLCGHAGEPITVECRFMQEDGSLVHRRGAAEDQGETTLFSRVRLFPQLQLTDFPRTSIEIPLPALELTPGRHVVTAEVSVAGANERVLCGLSRSVIVVVPDLGTEVPVILPAPGEHSIAEPGLGVSLAAFEVDERARFGRRSVVRCVARLRAHDWAGRAFRALVTLEDRSRSAVIDPARGVPMARAVSFVGAANDKGAREVVLTFPIADLTERAGEQLVARLRLFSLEGRLLLEASSALWLPQEVPVEIDEGTHVAEDRPLIVSDVFINGIEESGVLRCRVYLDVNLESYESDRFTVYYECVDSVGRSIGISGSPHQDLPGAILNFDLSDMLPGLRSRVGWFQLHVDLPCTARAATGGAAREKTTGRLHAVRVFLFSGGGRLLQTVTHELWPEKTFVPAMLPWTEEVPTSAAERRVEGPGLFDALGNLFRGKR